MKKILIVEDDKLLANALKVMFEANGFECKIALEGYYAIQTAFKEKPDLVITDLGIPAGGGLKVLKSLRDSVELMNTPAIIITGSSKFDQEISQQVKELGINTCLYKPFDNKALLKAVRKELHME